MSTTVKPEADESHDSPEEDEFELNLDSYVNVELEPEDRGKSS